MFDRNAICTRYPWLKPQSEPVRVVMGDDLDAALATAFYLHTHPAATLCGVYHKYNAVYYTAALDWTHVLDAVWLDLDIYHPRCRSLGHHIVRFKRNDQLPGLANSCNLNELGERFVKENFGGKYPLGTVHFLMWLYGVEIPARPKADLLLWLADSAYINGQAQTWHKRGRSEWVVGPGFRWNVHHWLSYKIPLRSLQTSFGDIDTPAFEQRMAELHKEMDGQGLGRGEGQIASHHLKLYGYQCQPGGDIGRQLSRLLQFAAAQTGWDFQPQQIEGLGALKCKSGARRIEKIAEVKREGLDQFLRQRQVFSYVFQNAAEINYTTGLD